MYVSFGYSEWRAIRRNKCGHDNNTHPSTDHVHCDRRVLRSGGRTAGYNVPLLEVVRLHAHSAARVLRPTRRRTGRRPRREKHVRLRRRRAALSHGAANARPAHRNGGRTRAPVFQHCCCYESRATDHPKSVRRLLYIELK